MTLELLHLLGGSMHGGMRRAVSLTLKVSETDVKRTLNPTTLALFSRTVLLW
jgi:hypothetical protein